MFYLCQTPSQLPSRVAPVSTIDRPCRFLTGCQIVDGLSGLVEDTERWAFVVVLVDVPEGVVLREGFAGDCVPVRLCICDRGDSGTIVGARYGPTSLGDPDRLAVGSIVGRGHGIPECGGSVGDRTVLEVGITVHWNERAWLVDVGGSCGTIFTYDLGSHKL
jgi:hypothetical protein